MAGISIRKWLSPDWSPGITISKLPISYLLSLDIHAAVIDVDRTLLPSRDIIPPKCVIDWIDDVSKKMQVHLFSNNPSKERISTVAQILNLNYTFSAAKPRRKALNKVINSFNVPPEKITMIGDRLFTDVICGNRLGLYTILVKPINSDGKPSQNDRLQEVENFLAKIIGVDF